MILEEEDFPLVRMRYDAPDWADGETAFQTFERLLRRETQFVVAGLGAAQHEASPDERKQVLLWMKRHRDALRRFVIVMVAVEPQAANRFIARAQAATYEKFWGFPMLVVASEDDAVTLATRLLSGELVADIVVDEPHVPSVA